MAASAGRFTTWRERISKARARQFVGRETELALWRDALEADEPPFAVLWLVGPGGIGKSTLLERLADLSREAGAAPIHLDARRLVGSQESLLEMLAAGLDAEPADVVDAFHREPRRVLLIDTAEDLGGLEDWLRDELLPVLPQRCLVAIAGRRPPGPAWRAGGGWAGLLRIVALRNLSPADSRRLLELRGVDLERTPQLIVETHGHPLSLALVADILQQDPDAGFIDPRSHPDIVSTLLARFVHDAPDEVHRLALAIAAHLRITNEAVLRRGLDVADVRDVFDWLASKSFAVVQAEGLHLHDLAAHAIDADFRRRDPDGYVAMHARLRAPIIEQLRGTRGAEQYRAAMDLSWLHRFSAVMGALVDWEGARALRPSPVGPGDGREIIEATRRFEGDEAAALAEHWLRERPESFSVVRSSPTRTVGYVLAVVIDGTEIDDPLVRRDPRVRKLIDHARATRPIQPADRLELMGWLHYETHFDPSAMVSQASIKSIRSWFGTPPLSWTAIACPARVEVWTPLMGYLDHHPCGEVEAGDARYAMFVHDWRTVTPTAFLDMMAEREISSAPDGGALAAPREVLALSHDEFVSLVKRALRELQDDDALAANPLSRCRFALEVPEPGEAPIRRAVELAAESLTRTARDETLHGALKLTYLDPARTQEEAAELLGLPFSTYRRHLAGAVDRVTTWLWERDLHGYEPVAAAD